MVDQIAQLSQTCRARGGARQLVALCAEVKGNS